MNRYPKTLTANQAVDALYLVADDSDLGWLDALMHKAGFRTESGDMVTIPNPPSGIVPAIAAAIYERSDGWYSEDEVLNVIEDYGEDAIWEGQLGPMLDGLQDALSDHRTDYRKENR